MYRYTCNTNIIHYLWSYKGLRKKQDIMKPAAAHMKEFGHEKASNEFYTLIDRLQKCSEINYPNRKWSNNTYYSIAFEWIGKDDELKAQVEKLESNINHSNKTL